MRRFARGRRSEEGPVAVEAPRPLRGLRFDLAEQAGRLRQLAPLVRGFRAPPGFQLWNGEYESVDAEVLWAMVQGLRPRRAMVVGAGEMTLKVLDAALPKGTARTEKPIELAERDVLVAGPPTPELVLEVLPELSPGVVVHVHPVRLPWPAGHGQDLLHAFLCGNRHFEVLLAHHALAREHPEAVRQAVPSWRGSSQPAALWLRRT
ncbi:MAG TPA: hypothetical protein VHF89_07850 [Solirubrobacteraceae bacterium]|nr:hypothetical protein [Solirubrobacteraceae bacterium]